MALEPAVYSGVQFNPHKVWFSCECGWHTPKRTPGKPPKAVIFRPFHCPKCNRKLSEFTVHR
jgi:hypothetical protein